MVEKVQLWAIALVNKKINFEGFPENGCYGQPQFLEGYLIALTVTIL